MFKEKRNCVVGLLTVLAMLYMQVSCAAVSEKIFGKPF